MFRILPRLINLAKSNSSRVQNVFNQKRNCSSEVGKWHYRKEKQLSESPRYVRFAAEFVMSVMWYNLLWHFYYDYERLLGHRPPVYEAWTDEELGIPPDDLD